MKKAFTIAAISLGCVLSGCTSESDGKPIEVRDPLTSAQKHTLEEMQGALDCFPGYRGTASIEDDRTITRPYAVGKKPSHVDSGKWAYWNSRVKNIKSATTIEFSRSSIEISDVRSQDVRRTIREFAEQPNIAFYVVGTTDGSISEEGMKNEEGAPRYVNLQTSLLRVNTVLALMDDEDVNPNRVCRAPHGLVNKREVGREDPNNRKVTIYTFDTGLE